MFSGLFSKPTVDIIIDEVEGRKKGKILNPNGEITRLPYLQDQENVSGKVIINCSQSKNFEHKGIKLELLGCIENITDSKDILKFISLTSELESIGILNNDVNTYPFKFTNVQKQYESFRGESRNIKYYLRLTIETKFRSLVYEQEFLVRNPEPISVLSENNQPIKLEVGIEDWLHLVFDLDSRNFGLKDIALGRVTFKKVSIRLKSMEVQIIRKEVVNVANVAPIQKVLTRFEIMDGGPIKNETIPIRFFLKPYDLTPSLTNINNRFSLQYFINIVLTDVEDRKYFKQHEIFFHRIQKVKKKKSESEDNGISEIKNEVKNENKNVISNESDNGNTNDGNNNEEEKLDE